MKQKLILLVCFLLSVQAWAQKGSLRGIVTNKSKQPMVGIVVTAILNNNPVARTATNVDGHYLIKNLKAGKYNITAQYTGFIKTTITSVIILANKTTTQNVVMQESTSVKEVVLSYKPPLIDSKKPGVNTTISAEQIKSLPTHNTGDVSALSTGVYQKKSGKADLNVHGARTARTLYIIDGMQVAGVAQYDASSKNVYLDPSTESYKKEQENDFMTVKANPLSTMSVDVDRASYSNIRRFINNGQKPPADAVRIEEMINYFNYDYPQPKGEDPIAIVTELTDCPWRPEHKLLHIGMQARKVDIEKLPPSNIVFLIDVSGSMNEENKLPLLKSAFKMLVDNLRSQDKVAIVVYAGNAGMVLPPTCGNNKEKIKDALEKLQAGGSTAGGAGIKLAYSIAQEYFIKGGNNRVILATDGDFNVGVSGDNELEDLITKERDKGIFLTCLGFGMGNYKDSKMEVLADKGNGNYAYIDNIQEAQKTLVSEFGGTLFTVAKDIKAQIEFNPLQVQAYRLIGYENRLLNEEDFKDDKKDAGDMGSGHSVTILYEIIPVGVKNSFIRSGNNLKYQQTLFTPESNFEELATIKFRYKKPDGMKSREMVHTISSETKEMNSIDEDTRFSAAVVMFGMLLKDSKYKGHSDYKEVIALAENSKGKDKDGYRSEFLRLVKSVR